MNGYEEKIKDRLFLDCLLYTSYGKIVGFLNDFFAMMNNMGVELFDLPWVNAITTFFGWLGWALFVVGLVVGAFECAIEYQGGRGSIKDTALNYVKGFMAVSLFSFLPVNLYSLSVSLQSSFEMCIRDRLTTIPDGKRIFTIENGSRELALVREKDGKVTNSVIHTPVSYTHLDVYKRQILHRGMTTEVSSRKF